MRNFTLPVMLLAVVFTSSSFTKLPDDDNGHYKNNGYFFAILNGNMFEMRDDDKYRAELINKTGTMSNSSSGLSRVANSLIFYGNEFKDEKGKLFDENIDFEYTFDEGSLGEPKDLKIEIHYDMHDYYQIPELTKFVVKNITWSEDRREFIMSADFDCRMRRWGFPAESQPVVRLKGRMVNINVTAPAWIKIKDPRQVAGN